MSFKTHITKFVLASLLLSGCTTVHQHEKTSSKANTEPHAKLITCSDGLLVADRKECMIYDPIIPSGNSDFSYCNERYRYEAVSYSTEKATVNDTANITQAVSKIMKTLEYCSIISIEISWEEKFQADDIAFLIWQEFTQRGVSPNIIKNKIFVEPETQKNPDKQVLILATLDFVFNHPDSKIKSTNHYDLY